MGKPSHPKSQSTRQSSTSTMGSHKKKKTKHRMQQNKLLSKSIQKLFQNLRNENESSTAEEYILNDSTSNITVISLDDTQPETSKKRKLDDEGNKPKRTKLDDSCTLIKDDDQMKTPRKTSPINCSTPKSSLKSSSECDISNVCDLTKEINSKSYLTIDLTTETLDRSEQNTVIDLEKSEKIDSNQNTVIDLDKTDADCSLVSVSVGSWSTASGVTVVKKTDSSKMRKIAKGIANLNADEKGKLLELITQKIFNGCNVNSSSSTMLMNQPKQSRATETAEDTYIKEVILGQSQSRNSIGSNIYNPEKDAKSTPLRMVVIDGSNVAMECKFGKSTEPRVLDSLVRQGLVVYTPSREVQGKCIASYDDRYIVQCAAEFDGVIVSGDNYRDLLKENPRWRFVIENRLLPFTWVDDMLMFPKDPLGRNGPTLEQMLKKT